MKWVVWPLLLLVLLVAGAFGAGQWRWNALTRTLHQQLDATRIPVQPNRFDARELTGLPAPVQRYFRAVLPDGALLVAGASVEHSGSFNLSETGEAWKPFTSRQRVVTRRPGFVWDARINMLPGVAVHVHDAYVGGLGVLHPALLGLVTLTDLRGTNEVAQGELMRFFAEAAWYPTALLPSQGVLWEPVDDRSAQATLTDGTLVLTMLFVFNANGLIETVRAEARGRTVGGQVEPTPWEGRWSNWQRRDGLLVPLDGEVAWLLPTGRMPYWRGSITSLLYQRAV